MSSGDIKERKKSVLEIFFDYLSRTPPRLLFIHLLWLIIASCALSSSYILAFHFTSVLSIYREAHNISNFNDNLRVSAKRDQEINTALQALLETTHSTRAYVFRYHNGLAAVNGVPFFFHTVTNEVISPGTPRVIQFERNIPSGINMAMNSQFMQNRCAVINNADADRESQNYWYYQSRGARSMIRCPIFMQNGDLFGFVGVDYSSDHPSGDIAVMVQTVTDASIAIAGIFANRRQN
jgi:hypothetical protein